jgi:hypothetical protein
VDRRRGRMFARKGTADIGRGRMVAGNRELDGGIGKMVPGKKMDRQRKEKNDCRERSGG